MCEGSESMEEGKDSSCDLMGFASRLTATSSWSTVLIIECRCCGRTGRLCVRLDLKGKGRASFNILLMFVFCRTAASLLWTRAMIVCRSLTGRGAL